MKHQLHYLLIGTLLILSACGAKKDKEIALLKQKLAQCKQVADLQDKTNGENDQLLADISKSLEKVNIGQDSVFAAIDAEEEKERILERIAQVDSIVDLSNNKIIALEKRLVNSNNQSAGLVRTLAQMKKELERKKAEVLALREEVKNLKGTINTQRVMLASKNSEINKINKTLKNTQTALEGKDEEVNDALKNARNAQFDKVNSQIIGYINTGNAKWALGKKTSRLTNPKKKWGYYQEAYNNYKQALKVYEANQDFAINLKYDRTYIEGRITALKDDIPSKVKRKGKVRFY